MSSVQSRIATRSFPSLFQAWSAMENTGVSQEEAEARHDLYFGGSESFGMQWNSPIQGLSTGFTPASIPNGRNKRASLLRRNPNIVLLLEIRYRDAHKSYLPESSPFWKRDKAGNAIVGWEEGGYLLLDFANPDYQQQVAQQARAACESGIWDGVMLDWWIDDSDRLSLVQKVRAAIGDALILVNANDRMTPLTARYVNGYFMECYQSKTIAHWKGIESSLLWAEQNLRPPHINCLETWYEKSRKDLSRMRATTTLALTHSDGYCLFGDPNDLPQSDHRHDWYPFWAKSLGKPKERGHRQSNGSWTRLYEKGTAIYNPIYNMPVTVDLSRPLRSLATGKRSRIHRVNPLDGDILLRT